MFIIGDVFLGLIPGVLAIIVVFFTAYRIQHRVRKIVCKVILIIILVALIFGQFYGALINLFDVLKAFYHPGDQMMLIIEIVVPLILGLGIAPLLLWLFSKIQIGYIQNM
jgi:glucan phosphoethanolaminetransferase (alkaline phosphatase superfamily)